jgi:integrase
LVFPATRGSGDVIMSGFKKLWKRIAKLGDLPSDVTPHVLRHSFASLAADLGYSEPVIAALVGHQGRSTTSRYLHSADAVLLAAADAVADRTLELMGEKMPKGEDRRASTIGTLISSRPGHVSNSLRATSFFR